MSRDILEVLLEVLEDQFGKVTQAELAEAIGVTQGTISNWMSSGPPKNKLHEIVNFFQGFHASNMVKPVIEFEAISPVKRGESYTFFPDKKNVKNLSGKIKGIKGIYIFYNSSGHAIYLGKSEVCVFGEARKRLSAPLNLPVYNPKKSHEPLVAEQALFISAYSIAEVEAIKNIESFMLRAFANDLNNKYSGDFDYILG
ncbi:helix-turn-helix transcriptional regulator [Parendozoicomonas sp. Alg238-R29]|uniref:helix-turn-helix domain-containing protein n=1 Tax=Parendozoicomonas sp. Alg238-R29 TaxID=2993446 RepID=UPI00248DE217|nr:helix-turn-helix transcriptional regulator [Parendozoicomonas sp. Alg238-R29]